MQHAPPLSPHDTAEDQTLASRLAAIRARIAAAAQASGRIAADVTLVAVSKTQPVEAVRAAMQAGQTVFGENRVQEAVAKFAALSNTAGRPFRVHLIGGLQTNKAADAVALADMIEVLDRPALADAIGRASDRQGHLPELLIQVNVGHEPQKSGIARDQADAFIETCRQRFGPAVRGLMCVPPADADPVPHFRWLAACAARHGLPTLSMGMSADFERAVACGATLVRVGSAIFGNRLQRDAAPA
jgi:pyridoxal phosphate enzyme (YggS family)